MTTLSVLIIVAVAILAILAMSLRRTIVRDFERTLLFRNGKFVTLLEPGAHWLLWPTSGAIPVDIRPRTDTVPGQEVLSADNVSVKISVVLRYRVADPLQAVRSAQSFAGALYLEAQVLVRDIVASLPIEELLAKRDHVASTLRAQLAPRAAALGLDLEMVGLKDIMFPGPLKRIFAQVVEARKSAQAALEKARGETATLRHLANAARLVEGNPALLMLKTLQSVSEGKNTIVLGIPQQILPVSREPEIGPPSQPHAPDEQPETD